MIAANRESPDALAKIYFTRGLMQRRLGQNRAALKDYNQSLRLTSDVYNPRCYLFAITSRLQEALKDCNEALRLNPRNQYAYDSRGFAYLKFGMVDAAIADYDAALGIEPGRPYSMAGRGFACRRKGDAAGGEADLAAARPSSGDRRGVRPLRREVGARTPPCPCARPAPKRRRRSCAPRRSPRHGCRC